MSSSCVKIGITGGIGSGKSFVAEILEKMGFPVFYSDSEAKRIINQSSDVKLQIVELLGDEAYHNDVYNVAYVSQKIFNDKSLRKQLNGIVHPAVRIAFHEWANSISQYSNIVFNEAAIMIESGAYQSMDKILLVSAPLDIRIDRVMKRDNITREHALARIESQSSDEYKRQFADFEVVNDGRALLPQITQIMDLIRP